VRSEGHADGGPAGAEEQDDGEERDEASHAPSRGARLLYLYGPFSAAGTYPLQTAAPHRSHGPTGLSRHPPPSPAGTTRMCATG